MSIIRMQSILWILFIHVMLPFIGVNAEVVFAEKGLSEKNQSLCLAFIAIDNSPWSEKLYQDILASSEFIHEIESYASFHLVFLEDGKIAQNVQEKLDHWNIREFPTVLLLDSEEEEITRTHFLPLSPAEYAVYLKKYMEEYQKLKSDVQEDKIKLYSEEKLQELYRRAKSFGFIAFQKQILSFGKKQAKSPFFFLEEYEEYLATHKRKDENLLELKEKILSLDNKNPCGAYLRIAMLDFHENVKRMKQKDKPSRAIKPLVEYLKKFGKKDVEHAWQIEMVIAQFLFSKNQGKLAIKHAEKSCRYAPEVVRSEVQKTVEYLKKQVHGS